MTIPKKRSGWATCPYCQVRINGLYTQHDHYMKEHEDLYLYDDRVNKTTSQIKGLEHSIKSHEADIADLQAIYRFVGASDPPEPVRRFLGESVYRLQRGIHNRDETVVKQTIDLIPQLIENYRVHIKYDTQALAKARQTMAEVPARPG